MSIAAARRPPTPAIRTLPSHQDLGQHFGRPQRVSCRNSIRRSAIRHAADLLARHPWLTFLLPFIVYMVVGSFEPSPPKPPITAARRRARAPIDEANNWFGLEYSHYPIVYTVKIALTIAAMCSSCPATGSFRSASRCWRSSSASSASCCGSGSASCSSSASCSTRSAWKSSCGLGERPAYNPLDQLAATPAWAYTFLAIRFLGLALVVPIIEEFFLRGFLMRFVVRDELVGSSVRPGDAAGRRRRHRRSRC